jgi:hypothetical protein
MDSDEEQLQIVSYEEPEAYAATSHSENRMGIKMTPKVPPQFDGQSSWFEYEDLIDDWLGITTLDADKHGPSLKNALIGSASFYKSMLDNALLRDPDRGLAHFKDTLRPYFVKGVNHVFLWRFLQMFRTYRGQSEFVHWIGRFEIAQKRLLASWSDLLDISDLPEADMSSRSDQEANKRFCAISNRPIQCTNSLWPRYVRNIWRNRQRNT